MKTLGMEPDEILSLLKTVAGILHLGNIEVKQRPREEWATIPTTTGQNAIMGGLRDGGDGRGEEGWKEGRVNMGS